MPAAIINNRLEKRCETCGKPAQFGTGVDLRAAMNWLDKGNIEKAKRSLGKWLCHEHWNGIGE